MISVLCPNAGVRVERARRSMSRAACVALAVAATQTGCGSFTAQRARFLDGWHPGRVIRIGRDVPSTSRCADVAPPNSAIQQPYVLVRYAVAPSRYAERVAVVPTKETVSVSTDVYVHIRDCLTPLQTKASLISRGVL
ncbi:hypothetical protein ACSFA8_26475 [Variovorax sp. RT4R15]|uniref:hypothetical protein n=1 Tax=Variovorax sp. RT4R15 TaxID=3443737 RepID=UPI003F48BE13